MVVAGIQERVSQRRISISVSRMFIPSFLTVFVFIFKSGSSIRSSVGGDSLEEVLPEIKNPLGLNQAEIVAGLAFDLLKQSKKLINKISKAPFKVKIGFHSGSAVGGIVGHKNYQYCLFGDTINTVIEMRLKTNCSSISYL